MNLALTPMANSHSTGIKTLDSAIGAVINIRQMMQKIATPINPKWRCRMAKIEPKTRMPAKYNRLELEDPK